MSTTEYRLSINLTAEEADDDGSYLGSTNVLVVDVTTEDLAVAVATLGSAVDVLAHRQDSDEPAQTVPFDVAFIEAVGDTIRKSVDESLSRLSRRDTTDALR